MKYKKSRSLSGDKIIWIARLGKRVVARADTEEKLATLLEKRNEALKRPKRKKRKKKLLANKRSKKTQRAIASSKGSFSKKKNFWDKI